MEVCVQYPEPGNLSLGYNTGYGGGVGVVPVAAKVNFTAPHLHLGSHTHNATVSVSTEDFVSTELGTLAYGVS